MTRYSHFNIQCTPDSMILEECVSIQRVQSYVLNTQQVLPLAHVPDSDAFVLGVAEDEFLSRVEQTAGDVVIVTTAGVYLPRLGIYNTNHTVTVTALINSHRFQLDTDVHRDN